MKLKKTSLSSLLVATLILSACGGSNSTKPKTTSVDVDPSGSILQLEDNISTNQGVDLVLYFPDDEITNIKWQQTAGESLNLLALNSKAIGFTPVKSGNYSFEVNFNKNGITNQSLTKSITVSAEPSLITTRLAHAVLSGNKVSLRAQLDESVDTSLIKWRQVAGPNVNLTELDSDGKLAVFFDAPAVNQDTYISFEAFITVQDKKHTDTVTLLVEPAISINNNAYFDTRVARVFPYNQNSPYKENLTHCVYSNTLTSSCTLSQLPLIAQEVNNSSSYPDINTIMDRVVVSHQWMGDRFKEFLINNDPHNDFKNLLRATTAIVISYDIRPSFYWAATGAIYLDANNFWQTAQERDTINEAPDYRSDFGNDLQFVMPWRFVKDNDYASLNSPASLRLNRSPNIGLYRLTSLMYHELAHANDFFPSAEWFIHSANTRILDAALSSDFESDQLAIAHPLQSQIMRDLAAISFAGSKPDETQKSYLPIDITSLFKEDLANDFYAYSSLREDYAMLFEELMMQQRFNIYRDVAITNQPIGSNISAQDYIVTWGQRGRIGEALIKPRVLFSAKRILPEFDSTAALQNVPSPIVMTSGKNWVENLNISPTPSLPSRSNVNSSKASIDNTQNQQPEFYQYHQKALPKH